jgi:ankyrin repeat protein
MPGAGDLFLEAVRQGNLAEVKNYINTKEADIQVRDGLGSSALLLAARKTDNLELVQYLYELDPSALEAGDSRGRTPLSWASQYDRRQIAAYLIQKGATIESVDRARRTPLFYAAMTDARVAAGLLLAAGAQVNVRDELCDTPLMLAASKGHVEMVALLVKHGADPGYEDQEGRTVLDRLQHNDPAVAARIKAILKNAPRSAMNPACEAK